MGLYSCQAYTVANRIAGHIIRLYKQFMNKSSHPSFVYVILNPVVAYLLFQFGGRAGSSTARELQFARVLH
jgi:hypothetical protein